MASNLPLALRSIQTKCALLKSMLPSYYWVFTYLITAEQMERSRGILQKYKDSTLPQKKLPCEDSG
jgi:hypothetical protein